MGLLDRLFGSSPARTARPRPVPATSEDARALERYRYMVKTAPPETIEQAHAEAFSRLSPEQRRIAREGLANASPASERAALERISSDDPTAMARAATRAEIRQPGAMERVLGGSGLGASLLGSFAAAFAGSLVAQSFFSALGPGEAEANPETEEPPADDEDLSGGDYGDGGLGGDFEL